MIGTWIYTGFFTAMLCCIFLYGLPPSDKDLDE